LLYSLIIRLLYKRLVYNLLTLELVEQLWDEDRLSQLSDAVLNWALFRQNSTDDSNGLSSVLDIPSQSVEDIPAFEAYTLLSAKYGNYSGRVSPYPPIEPVRGVGDVHTTVCET
jgi:hypothetical protein